MNKGHSALCSSPRWADFITSEVLPAALRDHDLGADILEIGPGYGASTAKLVEPGRTVTAVEIDPQLAGRLRQTFPQLTVVEGSGDDLPFPDEHFSAAVCFTMLHHVHSVAAQDALFSQVRRVLRPGGLFAGSDSIASPGLRAFHHHDTYTPVDPEGLGDRLELAGFGEISVEISPDREWFAFSGRTAA